MGDPAERGLDLLYMPEEMRLDFCVALLEEVGAQKINIREDRKEILHACALPWHNERRPSASLNFEKMVYRCLPAETVIKTYEGERRIGDLAGQTVRVLDGRGKWVEAPINHYGVDRLLKVTLSRNGIQKVVHTTADHRWYIRAAGDTRTGPDGLREVSTRDLKPRHRIPSVWAMNRTTRTTISRVGVQAGFVFGDGSRTAHSSVANFYGEKDQALIPYFEGHSVVGSDPRKVTSGLPRSWKDLPSLDEGVSYLFGWLAGYFAADGCVADDGHVTLACADLGTLEFVRAICDRLGIATYSVGTRSRVGRSGRSAASYPSEIHSLSFRSSTLRPEFFLIPSHRDRYEASLRRRKYERTHWWVVSVEETDRVEDVYCAEVSTTSSFVLADNLLTGNCLGCNSKGGILWLIGAIKGLYGPDARTWLAEQSGLGGKEFQLGPLLQFLDSLEEAQKRSKTNRPLVQYSDAVLAPWEEHIYPGLTTGVEDLGIEGRGLPEQNLREARVGWDMDDNRIIIPHFWKGALVGWQARRIIEDDVLYPEKYKSTPDFPRDRTIYRPPPERGKRIVVVESPMSVLRHMHHLPIGGTFGFALADAQLALLRWYPEIIFWVDNDPAGWKTVEGSWQEDGRAMVHTPGPAQALTAYSNVKVVVSDWVGDPAEIDEDTAEDLVSGAVPLAVWERPTALRCMKCRQTHTGFCSPQTGDTQ